jgi:hypothetical protein
MMRKAIIHGLSIIFLFALFGYVGALELRAPDSVPAHVNWSATVGFGKFNFDEVRFYLDDKPVLFGYLVEDEIELRPKSEDIVRAWYSAPWITVSFAGLTEGNHILQIKLIKDKVVIDQVKQNLRVYQPPTINELKQLTEMSQELEAKQKSIEKLQQQLYKDLNTLQYAISKLEESLDVVQEKLSEQSTKTQDMEGQLEQTEEALDDVKTALSKLQIAVNKNAKELASTKAKLEAETRKRKQVQTAQSKDAIAGLVGLVTTPALAVIIVVLLIGVVGYIVYKRRFGEPAPLFEVPEELSGKEEAGDELLEEAMEETTSEKHEKKGRWAYEE